MSEEKKKPGTIKCTVTGALIGGTAGYYLCPKNREKLKEKLEEVDFDELKEKGSALASEWKDKTTENTKKLTGALFQRDNGDEEEEEEQEESAEEETESSTRKNRGQSKRAAKNAEKENEQLRSRIDELEEKLEQVLSQEDSEGGEQRSTKVAKSSSSRKKSS
ncbi:GvpT/GvpP family gas vesicle accessory protein [Alkalicoccus chagannorensis]|uniref:GvpT/GvpP family gas vesicle accessory protein n=1 Tax=Alkalicoccus chagannorensis TaxID=427072 RepID=UPI00041C8D06|nr:GvpT/GvpP family gas vesicle accessory protein [Alkalicoccus chagannorensis]